MPVSMSNLISSLYATITNNTLKEIDTKLSSISPTTKTAASMSTGKMLICYEATTASEFAPFHPDKNYKFSKSPRTDSKMHSYTSAIFKQFPHMNYNKQNDSIACVMCKNALKDNKMKYYYNVVKTSFSREGFRNQ